MSTQETSGSAIMYIRHGDTTYSETFPSLTKLGQAQIEQTAEKYNSFAGQFDHLLAWSSPSARALESMQSALKVWRREEATVRESRLIRPFDIKDLRGFLDYDKTHATDKYGQMWLTDSFLSGENPLTEGRISVEDRSFRYLLCMTDLLRLLEERTSQRFLLVTTAHFEVIIPVMKGLYTEAETFPIETEDVIGNGEAIVVHLGNGGDYQYVMEGRNRRTNLSFNPRTRCFVHNGN